MAGFRGEEGNDSGEDEGGRSAPAVEMSGVESKRLVWGKPHLPCASKAKSSLSTMSTTESIAETRSSARPSPSSSASETAEAQASESEHQEASGLLNTPSTSTSTPTPTALHLLSKISTLESQVAALISELAGAHTQLQCQLLHQQPLSTRLPPLTNPSPLHPSSSTTSPPTAAVDQTAQAAAATIVHRHIRLLHQYNEIKDIGLGLIGLIAESRGVRVAEVMGEFGVGGKD